MKEFQPVILGTDINAYGMARAFHEAYGLVSTAFGHYQLSPTKYSRILDVHLVPDFTNPKVFASALNEWADTYHQEHPGTTLLLLPCGDSYANLLDKFGDSLRERFAFNAIDQKLNRSLSLKSSFYELCDRYDLPHPKTVSVDAEDVKAGRHRNLPFDYPVAMKPADSDEWLGIDFPGRKKAFIFSNPEELDTMIRRSYQAGYTSQMVIQDFVPGGDDHMRVLNAYVDRHHRVRMMFLGHPLLEDPTPEAVGNYAAIMPDYNQDIFDRIKAFLEDINYSGVANFDMKYDPRDGVYKLFEINLRQGRSSYVVTLNGFNLARCFVDDLVLDTPFNGRTVFGRGHRLWMEIPKDIFRKYCAESEDKRQAMSMIRRGDWGTTLEYSKDRSFKRWLLIRHMFSIYRRRYRRYFRDKRTLA